MKTAPVEMTKTTRTVDHPYRVKVKFDGLSTYGTKNLVRKLSFDDKELAMKVALQLRCDMEEAMASDSKFVTVNSIVVDGAEYRFKDSIGLMKAVYGSVKVVVQEFCPELRMGYGAYGGWRVIDTSTKGSFQSNPATVTRSSVCVEDDGD